MLSDHGSDQFKLFVSRAEQARWLTASYRIADSLDSVAGLGWLSLLDEPERSFSSNWGLLTSSGARKPAYRAYRAAPSERFRPRVRLPARVRPGRRLVLRVRPRTTGRVTVVVRRGQAATGAKDPLQEASQRGGSRSGCRRCAAAGSAWRSGLREPRRCVARVRIR